MNTPAAAGRRPLKVGLEVTVIDRPMRWPDIATLVRTGEEIGLDPIWTADHFLYRTADGTADAPWDAPSPGATRPRLIRRLGSKRSRAAS